LAISAAFLGTMSRMEPCQGDQQRNQQSRLMEQGSDTHKEKNKRSQWTETEDPTNFFLCMPVCSPWRQLAANGNHRSEEGSGGPRN